MKTDKILFVANDSEASINAIKYGFNLAKELGAKVALLSIIEPAATEGNVDAGIFPDDAEKKSENKIIDFLERVRKEHGKDTDTEFIIKAGEINSIVAVTAKDWGAKLIVIGTHQHTGFSRLFNGSVSESVIKNSPVPVCVVPME